MGAALKIPLLCARPMLLAHIPDIVKSKQSVGTVGDLYKLMVDAWIERETAWVDKAELRRFSERLAVDIYANRSSRGGERIRATELNGLASKWEIKLKPWQMAGRSLLNRDADGNYKFAHRSIMEYLVAARVLEGSEELEGHDLTDQIQRFVFDAIGEPVRLVTRVRLTRSLREELMDHNGWDDDLRVFHAVDSSPGVPLGVYQEVEFSADGSTSRFLPGPIMELRIQDDTIEMVRVDDIKDGSIGGELQLQHLRRRRPTAVSLLGEGFIFTVGNQGTESTQATAWLIGPHCWSLN